MTARLKAELLLLWERSDKKPDTNIFGRRGKGISDFKRSYNKACKDAKVVGLRIHDWRHLFASDLMQAGVNPEVSMKATGHTEIETHFIYRNIDRPGARRIAEALDQLHQGREGIKGKSKSATATAGD